MTRRVDQLLSGFVDGDAISAEARVFRASARALGYESDIYAPADRIGAGVGGDCRSLDELSVGTDDALILHYSIGSASTDVFRSAECRKVMRYHNITPAEFFDGYDDAVAGQLRSGRMELAEVARAAGAVWADSAFNASELERAGIKVAGVTGLALPAGIETEPDQAYLERYGGGLRNILFVGRMAPNKCIEDLIVAFAWYNRLVQPASRLILTGSDRSCPRYYAMLKFLAGRLGLQNVCFEGFLNAAQLAACYRKADIFVCASRHEGYCLPLVEAMCHGVPVVARDTGGMPEAMGGAGVLYDEMSAPELAGLIDAVVSDQAIRREILASQVKRIKTEKSRDIAGECRKILASCGIN